MASYHNLSYLIATLTLILLQTTTSWDPYKPDPAVKALCTKNKNYKWCIDTLNNGATTDADMNFLADFAVDLVKGNATWGIDYINKTMLPNEVDPYVHEVMNACLDAFTKVQSIVSNKVDNYVFFSKYQEAKPWGVYALATLNSCQMVCSAKHDMKCPLLKDIYGTKDNLILLNDAIELAMNGVF